jgi:Xaa-Pro aminopeptidase
MTEVPLQRSTALAQLAATEGLAASVAFSPEAVFYLSGAAIMTQRILPDRLAIVVTSPDQEPTLIVCNIEEDLARTHSAIRDIRQYVEYARSPIDVLVEVLGERCPKGSRIGLELGYLNAAYCRSLEERTRDAEFAYDDVTGLIRQLRMHKDAEELAVLERGFLATDRAIRSAFEASHIGDTEKQLGARIADSLLANGADGVGWILVGFGETSHLVHQLPTDKVMKQGDLVRIDCGAAFNGYFSDLARSCFAGTPSEHQRSVYARLVAGHDRIIETMAPGVQACAVFEEAVRIYRELGIPFRDDEPHCGHSIGLGIHEHPVLNPFERIELAPGMVFCVEPPYFAPTGEFFHTEDLVVITEDGRRVVSRSADWVEPLLIGS